MSSSARKPSDANNSAFVNASQWDAKHLADMISRVNDPLVADILVGLFEEHSELKLKYLGVYAKAWETLRRAELIQENAYKVGLKIAQRRRKVAQCFAWTFSALRDFFKLVRDEFRKALKESREANTTVNQSTPPSTEPRGDNVICLPMAQRPIGTDR